MRHSTQTSLAILIIALVGSAHASINTQAQLRAIKKADLLVENYRNALKLNDPVVRMNAAMELQSNPMAVQRANAKEMNLVKNNLNKDLNAIRDRTKALIKKDLAVKLGVKESDITFFEATNTSRKAKGAKPGKIKVGQDWDVTVRVNGKDIPISQSRPSVENAFYEACNNKRPKTPADAKAFSSKQYVEVTNRTHSEAYGLKTGEGKKIITGSKAATDFDSAQVTKVIQYKSDVPGNKAEQVLADARNRIKTQKLTGDEARQVMLNAKSEAIVHRREQCRQASKQFRNQGAKRVKALGGKVPKAVAKQASIIRQMGEGVLTYEEGLIQLKGYGTLDDAIRNVAGLTESAVKLKAAKIPVASCQGLVKPKKKGLLSSVKSVFSKGTAAGQAAKTTLMNSAAVKTALGASSVLLTGTTVVGTLSQGSLEEKQTAAKADREYSYGHAATNVFKNTVLVPAGMIKTFLDNTVGQAVARTTTVVMEENTSEKSLTSTFGNTLVRLSEDFLDKRDDVLVQSIEMGTQVYDYASEDPVRFAGDVTMINVIAENATYDSQADRTAFRQLRTVGKRTQEFLGEKMLGMSRLQSQISDIVFARGFDDPAVKAKLDELSGQYAKLQAEANRSKQNWEKYKANWKTGDATDIVAQLDKNMGALFSYTNRMPKDPIDYACKKQRQIVGPMKVSASIPSKTFIKAKTYFSITVSGGDSPYHISWEASNGKTVDQTLTSSGSKSCWFRFAKPGDQKMKLSVYDSCAETQMISSEAVIEVIDFQVALEIPKEPVSAKTPFTALVKIQGGTAPFRISGNINGTTEGRSAKSRQIAPEAPGDYGFQVQVTDAQGLTLNASKTLRVSESLQVRFTIPYTSVSPEKEFPAYITIMGGVPPYRLSGVVSAETAERVTDVRITAPKEPGEHVFALRVTDAAQTTVEKRNTLEVRGGFTAVLNPAKESVTPGEKVAVQLKINGGTPPYDLSMDARGQISGTSSQFSWTAPGQVGPASIGVMIMDSKGLPTMANCKMEVQEPYSIVVKKPEATVAPNTRIPMELLINGGMPPFSLHGAASGETSQRRLKFTYVAAGKPGSSRSYVTCTDKTNRLARHSFTVVVGNTPQVTLTPAKKTATSGESVSVTYAIKNGTPPFLFSGHANGTTSKRQGTFKVTMPNSGTGLQVKATIKDKENISTTATTWIGVVAAKISATFQLPESPLEDGYEMDTTIDIPFTINGGTPPYTLSGLVQGKMTSGKGVIEYTTMGKDGTETHRLNFTDKYGSKGTATFTITVDGSFDRALAKELVGLGGTGATDSSDSGAASKAVLK